MTQNDKLSENIKSNNVLTTEAKKEESLPVESVLVMQGGGSLGAYECGVYKTLSKHKIKFDIVAGTSIGAINAAIITAYQNDKSPSKVLEDFWVELAQKVMPPPNPFSNSFFSDKSRAILASIYSATLGNPKAFSSMKLSWPTSNYFSYYMPYPLFDTEPLKETLENYVDFSNLENKGSNASKHRTRPRLIVTSTDIQTSKPVVFDSNYDKIDAESIIASAAFPFYGIGWTKKENKYLWDGSLLSNTPLNEVLERSPILDKIVYLVSIFPHHQHELPHTMFDAWHRARDIIHTDRTDSNIKTSVIMSNHLSILRNMYDLLIKYVSLVESQETITNKEALRMCFDKISNRYKELSKQRGAIIHKIVRIERTEKIHYLFEDADFSLETICKLIKQGENDAEKVIKSTKDE